MYLVWSRNKTYLLVYLLTYLLTFSRFGRNSNITCLEINVLLYRESWSKRQLPFWPQSPKSKWQQTWLHQISECFTFFLIYRKNITTSRFGCFEHVWLFPSKKDNGDFDVYLHAKMNSMPNFFFEIIQRFANLLLWVLWECFIMLINNNSITL